MAHIVRKGAPDRPGRHHHGRTRWRIAQLALASRVLVLLAMSISCSILPDFYPGDDVLQFDLRLTTTTPSSSASEGKNHCFCLQGHGCDFDWKSRRRYTDVGNGDGKSSCADDSVVDHAARYSIWLDRFYAFILPPVTKWDAARFLSLSVDPWARYPPHLRPLKGNENDDQTCNSNDTTCTVPTTNDEENERSFYSSEQAHAFFPLLPLVIRYTANFLMRVIPSNILPPTYEATAALSAILINMLAFVIASISLYDLTISILKRGALEMTWVATKKNNDNDRSKLELESEAPHPHCILAQTAAQLFCINPAAVFFTTAYSESMFAMLTFAGHAVAARGQCYLWHLKTDIIMTETKLQKGNVVQRRWWLWTNSYWVVSTMLWMLASYTRSNGTFSSIWLVLVGVSKCCSIINMTYQSGKRKCTTMTLAFKCLSALMFHGVLALVVAYPVYFHDQRGYNFHCLDPMLGHPIISQQYPTWCGQYGFGGRFSLYAYVQRKHWNVGLFRYYELKQIPNFILALPVLALSLTAAASWIRYSWDRHMGHESKEVEKNPFGRIFAVTKQAFAWAFLALSASSCNLQWEKKKDNKCSSNKVPSSTILGNNNQATRLLGPKFLSYYAILAGFALVGTFLAHVQISTRLICSSCPALYWFVASFMVDGQTDSKGKYSGVGGIYGFASHIPMLLLSYFGLYNILGFIMHVNWLPWT